jgi:SAM-dependent methyltransferase
VNAISRRTGGFTSTRNKENITVTDVVNGGSAGAGNGSRRYYKKDFWAEENLKFSQPWYRLEKVARIIRTIAGTRRCTLLDVGCGPATLGRLLPANIDYYGIDIAIHNPAPNLVEADLTASPIRFGDKRFDLVVAQGVFEYLGDHQSEKFAEIAAILNPGATLLVSYTNFAHRKPEIYTPFSNVQPIESFRDSLAEHFVIDRCFPSSYNWKHAQPNRPLVKAVNMRLNVNIPVITPWLAVEYFFICSVRQPA